MSLTPMKNPISCHDPEVTALHGAVDSGVDYIMVVFAAEIHTHQDTLVSLGVAGVFLNSLETIDGCFVLVAQFFHERAKNLDLLAGHRVPRGSIYFPGESYPQVDIVVVNEQVFLLTGSFGCCGCSASGG